MKKIIGFAGRKRSGKGLLTEVIKSEEKNVVVITVANYLKLLCCDILGIDLDTLNERKDNGYTFEIYPDEKWFNIIHKKTNISLDAIKNEISNIKFINIRQMLQVIGTDLIRKYNNDWHINSMIDDINSYSDDYVIAVDDVRFPNEVQAIKNMGGEVFFIIRPNWFYDISNHISETSLTWCDFDKSHIIINDLSKEKVENYFRIAYKCDFNYSEYNPIFLLHNIFYYDNRYCFDNQEIEKIIERNKDNQQFLEKGLLTINIKGNEYAVYNPLFNEDLKMYF